MVRCCVHACRLSIIVLWLFLQKKCLKRQIGLPDRYPVVPIRAPYDLHCPLNGVLIPPPNTCIVNCGQTASVSGMVTNNDNNRNLPTSYATVQSTHYLFYQNRGSLRRTPKFAWRITAKQYQQMVAVDTYRCSI